jgi:hypothetical protein
MSLFYRVRQYTVFFAELFSALFPQHFELQYSNFILPPKPLTLLTWLCTASLFSTMCRYHITYDMSVMQAQHVRRNVEFSVPAATQRCTQGFT